MTEQLIPNPGSRAAVDAGCICPVLDNARGRGYMLLGDVFVTRLDCPLHGAPNHPPSGAPRDEEATHDA